MLDECPKSSYQVLLAGGYFTDYSDNNLFTKYYPSLYEYFVKGSDIDLFYSLKTGYTSHESICGFPGYSKDINILKTVDRKGYDDNCRYINQFDYDCCQFLFFFNYLILNSFVDLFLGKIYYSYSEDQLYAHVSFFVGSKSIVFPSFFTINLELVREMVQTKVKIKQDRHNRSRCVFCSQFIRILKYNMKGFFDPNSLIKEFKQSESIFAILFEKKNYGYDCKLCSGRIYLL
jgi:hypothetical protein